MNCHESQKLISVLYDGEPVPSEFADHVDTCPHCRETLRAYSEIGAELRLLASRESATLVPPLDPPARTNRFLSITGKMRVPKLAVAAAAALLLVMSADLFRVVHAQQNQPPLWFQFDLSPKGSAYAPSDPPQYLEQAGYDDVSIFKTSANVTTAVRINISRIYADHVELAIRARFYPSSELDFTHAKNDLKDLTGHSITYRPGTPVEIPVEGGGTLILNGEIHDRKPKYIGSGIPLDPATDQLILANPLLISGSNVLFNRGGMARNRGPEAAVGLYVPGTGLIKISFSPTPGAVPANANWTNLDFTLDGKTYTLRTISPITGGDQPRTLWISNNPTFSPSDPRMKSGFVMAGSLKSFL